MPRIKLPKNRHSQQRRPQKSRTASASCLTDPLVLLMCAMVATSTAFVGMVLLGGGIGGDRLSFPTMTSFMKLSNLTETGFQYNKRTSTTTIEGRAVNTNTTTAVTTRKDDDVVVVAYAVTITHCTSERHSLQLLDSAAVVKHSIHLATSRSRHASIQQHNNSQSKYNNHYYHYDYQMYAFLHVDARSDCATVASRLEHQLGYTVQWHATPFALDDVARTNPLLAEKIHKQGCCEEKELVKLYTLQLTEHKIAVHLDLDTILLQPLDHLFHAMLLPPHHDTSRQLVQQHMQQHEGETRLPHNITCFFTRDYNMANPGIQPPRVGMQGGFWVVRPDPHVMTDIVSLIVDHADHYNKDCGWGPCELGSARFYGGAGFQGILSYFYTYVQPQSQEPQAEPQFVELDRCLYNTMVDPPRSGCYAGKDTVACHSCQETEFADLYGAHFTLCQKPYNCPPMTTDTSMLCYRLHHAWHAIRADFEARRQQQQATDKNKNVSSSAAHLTSLPPPSLVELGDPTLSLEKGANPRLTKRLVQKFSTHCPKVGKKAYQFMTFE